MSSYQTVMSLALTPGIYLYIIPSGFMDFMRSLASPFSKNPHDDEEDVFAQHDYPDSDVRKVSTSGAAATCDFKFIQSQAQNVFSCFQTTPGCVFYMVNIAFVSLMSVQMMMVSDMSLF